MKLLKKQLLLIAGISAFLPLTLLLRAGIPQLTYSKGIQAGDVLPFVKDGDIICRLGDRLWSQYFKNISNSDKRYSHLGIIRINEGNVTVINAEGRAIEGKDFVNETPLDEFLKIAKSAGIYRLKNYDGKLISDAAMDFIGYPFDWEFNMEDESKIYCTELLYAVLKKTAPEIKLKTVYQKELKTEIIPLEACSNSEHFTEILCINAK